jgi:hypothetical protein
MIKRIAFGLLLGSVVGSIVAALVTQGLHFTFVGGAGAFFAYAFAALVGVLTGLVAGKPIWSQTGKIEAGLKAFFGALLAAGMMFALRKWIPLSLDLTSLNSGAGPVGDLPLVALPAIAGVLGAFFEADNTPEDATDGKAAAAGKDATGAKVRVAAKASAKAGAAVDDDDDAGAQSAAKKRR